MENKIISALNLYRKLSDKADKIDEVFGSMDLLVYEVDACYDLICDLAEIPPDNTVEMEEKYGDGWWNEKETYCRDWVSDVLGQFTGGKNSAEKTAKILLDWKNFDYE